MKKRIFGWILFFGVFALLTVGGSQSAQAGKKAKQWKPAVKSGLDVLQEEGFARLKGHKIGLITNHSGLNCKGKHILDLLNEAPGVELVAIFAPEHGIRGTADEHVADGKDAATGLPIYSLYGKTQRPTDEMLEGIDTLVFDIQDIGARFYTYIGTMGKCMEEAGKRNIKFIVLDRPNPIGGKYYDGPVQDENLVGGNTNFRLMPTVHGMTIGEMARMYISPYGGIDVDLEVVKMKGWKRDMYFDECGLPWVDPSPNMRSLDQEILYTMVAQTEANKDLSVGRGTERPFEYLGAPWVDGEKLTQEMRARNLPGLWFMQATFVPRKMDVSGRKNYPYQFSEEINNGFRVVITDREAVRPVEAGIHMLDVLLKLYPERYKIDRLRGLVGAQWVIDALKNRESVESIVSRWREMDNFKAFEKARRKALLYR